ncbi:hypothetical protein AUEXF2481DRAFT_84004 [Aureobasidium subglaciale EXF-2481]|uniref:Zn(2)-C6 fungal-type domain-containing protein n=1 Tax=Aureobasidium subglaciale (strain EXF-2481) TaxID=1043005 RepID=A0A074Y303_AURSE|nr:uncharacterized protein AUEXF2481DRAFT_84004 [Aureobasidium subglaciale EXF-2481]KEQ90329.1 hypothetical protein AUEXF2481DRAFT_84004 [Aureobasidium subglaciale EXF-2481]
MALTPTTLCNDSRDSTMRRRRESSATAPDAAASAKRRKVQRACDNCKSRKRKCSGEQPCPLCVSQGLICTFVSPHGRQQELPHSSNFLLGASYPCLDPSAQSQWSAESVSARRPLAGYAPNTNETSRAASPNGEGITPAGYQGPTSTFSFLRKAWRRFGMTEPPDSNHDSREEISIFAYGDRRSPALDLPPRSRLPDRGVTTPLVSRYFDFAAPTYRFLHRPTLESWLSEFHQQQGSDQEGTAAVIQGEALRPVRQAIVLMVLATACLYNVESGDETGSRSPTNDFGRVDGNHSHLQLGEALYEAAQQSIGGETGRPRLESVQARLATSLYQLNTSRLNQAWHTLGSTYQLALSIGIHRAKAPGAAGMTRILRECQRRCFWAVHMLDTYLSVMLGRPPYINDAYVDQRLPEIVDDNDILLTEVTVRSIPKDCVQAAPVMHAKLTRIVKEALKEQALLHPARDQHMIATAQRLGVEIEQWRSQLPLFLSGGIHPSSLIPIFRRQLTVLQIGCAHAVMIITRPLLSGQLTEPGMMQPHIEKCLSAAKFVLDLVLDLAVDNNLIPAFWNTQYVTFNALTIVYVWIMQRKQGRLSVIATQHDEMQLFELAKSVQAHLARATNTNAPSLRYSIILEELQQELSYSVSLETRPWEELNMNFPMDPELWLQLDTLLFSTVD